MPNRDGLRSQEDMINDILKGHHSAQTNKLSINKLLHCDTQKILNSHGELINRLKKIELELMHSRVN